MKVQHEWAFPDADEFMAHEIKPDGSYQGSHLRMALGYVTDWSLAVDCGAHVGTWAKPLAERFVRVIAVEPCPDTFEALTLNMRRFAPSVELRHVAVGEQAGFVSMVLDGRGAELANTGARYVQGDGVIPCETIDEWNLPSLGFLKLDIEGSEPAALRGARETIARCRPIILFEDKFLWRRYGEPRDAPQQFLLSLGYQHLVRATMDEIWGPQ